MKRFGNLYNNITEMGNLYAAFCKARKTKSRQEIVRNFEYDLEYELLRLKKELTDMSYKPGEYKAFYLYDPKKRKIVAAPFRDRVMHHALCNIIEPIFDRRFCFDSYACRIGKGTHAAVNRLQHFIRKQKAGYALKCDIAKYFRSISHNILKTLILKKIKDRKVLILIDKIIDSYYEKINEDGKAGIPIGNLTSQLFANIYLNELDRFIKETLKIPYYVRYVDDFIMLGKTKEELRTVKQKVEIFLSGLGLSLKANATQIIPLTQGVDFLGYHIFSGHKRLRNANVRKFRRRLKLAGKKYINGHIKINEIRQSVESWLGHACFADTYGLRQVLLGLPKSAFAKASAGKTSA